MRPRRAGSPVAPSLAMARRLRMGPAMRTHLFWGSLFAASLAAADPHPPHYVGPPPVRVTPARPPRAIGYPVPPRHSWRPPRYVAPPPVRWVRPPPAPSPRHVWAPGYWRWSGNRYAWTGGRWMEPPLRGWVWIAPIWALGADGSYVFVEGRWARPGYGALLVDVAPPSPLGEAIPPAPWPDAVWIPGYWAWMGERWSWVAGYWQAARPGWLWESPRWVPEAGRWRFVPGGWRPVEPPGA